MRKVRGNLVAGSNHTFAIVSSRFNETIVNRLLDGCIDTLLRHGGSEEQITCVEVPGAFELPLAAQKLARSGKYTAVICLGTVIRGATPHFDYVCGQAASGILKTGLDTEVPVIFGVLTTDTIEQAIERSGTKAGNKGAEAALAALEMGNLMAELSGASSMRLPRAELV